jgi:Asp/Glu/hydantoin racemase
LSLTPALPALGVIELANRPLTFQGCLGNARSFPYPVLYETAQGAYVKRIVDADPLLSETYCAAAERLERRGATAIMATCGFAAVYQQAVAARTKLPVLLSPLLLLPLLLHALPAGRRLAILTYDSRQLDVRFLRAGGIDPPPDRIVVAGIEDSPSWLALAAPQPELELAQLREDVLETAQRALQPENAVSAVLLECSAFCPFADEIRALGSVPVTDFHTTADLVMGMARGR